MHAICSPEKKHPTHTSLFENRRNRLFWVALCIRLIIGGMRRSVGWRLLIVFVALLLVQSGFCVVLFLSHFRPAYRRQTHASLWKTRKKRGVICCNIHRMTCRNWFIGSVDGLIGFVLYVFVFSSLQSQADCSTVYVTRSLRETLSFVDKTNRQKELLLFRAIIIDLRVGRM